MKRTSSRPPVEPRPKQQTSDELVGALLDFIRLKLYPDKGHWLAFQKDRRRLLQWVVLWPAGWLNQRGVVLPPERYRELVTQVILDALMHGAERVNYIPAWLGKAVQSHFHIHEEQIYEEAKALRSREALAAPLRLLERLAGQVPAQPVAPHPIDEMATAGRLLKQPKRPAAPPAVKGQLSLL